MAVYKRFRQQSGTAEAPSYEAEADALFAAMSSQPNDTRKGHINTLVAALKSAGVWSKCDALYVIAAHDAQAAGLNWIAPSGGYNLTAVNSPTFLADRHYVGDGSTSYLDTGMVRDALSNYTRNSAHIAAWSRNSPTANANRSILGSSAGNNCKINTQRTSLQSYTRLNCSVDVICAVPDGSGLFAANRSGASAEEVYRNGSSIGSGTTASAALGAHNIWLLRDSLGYSLNQVSFASVGASLSAAEHSALYNAVATYMTAVGA